MRPYCPPKSSSESLIIVFLGMLAMLITVFFCSFIPRVDVTGPGMPLVFCAIVVASSLVAYFPMVPLVNYAERKEEKRRVEYEQQYQADLNKLSDEDVLNGLLSDSITENTIIRLREELVRRRGDSA